MTARALLGRRPVVSPWWACGALVVLWGVLLGMVLTQEGLAEGDAPVLGWLVGHRTVALDGAFEWVSDPVLDGGAALLAGGLVLLVAVRSRSVRPVVTLAAVVAGATVLAELIKLLVGRARPPIATMLGTPESGPGFPSAHTLVFSALAGAVALVVWRATPARAMRATAVVGAVVVSTAMGASRLYLGDHWLTDVLASYAMAGVVLVAVAAWTSPASSRAGQSADQAVSGGRR